MKRRLFTIPALCLTMFVNGQTNPQNPATSLSSTGTVFLENQGQVIDINGNARPDVLFSTIFQTPKLYVCQNAISYVFAEPSDSSDTFEQLQRIDLRIVNEGGSSCDFSQITALEPVGASFNFIKSSNKQHWKTNLNGFTKLVCQNVVPGVSMELFSTSTGMQCNLILNPSVDPSTILFQYSGANDVKLNGSKTLVIVTNLGIMNQRLGIPFQLNPQGNPIPITSPSSFSMSGTGLVGFNIGQVLPNRPLVIPITVGGVPNISQQAERVEWCTYVPGEHNDVVNDIVADNQDNVYVTGLTGSSNLPVNDGVIVPSQFSYVSDLDVFIAKFDANNVLQWMTYYGGLSPRGSEAGQSLVLDANNSIYVTGQTESDSTSFPVFKPSNSSAFQQKSWGSFNFNQSAFIGRFDAQTGIADWSTAFGVGDVVVPTGIDYDNDNNIYIAGVASVFHDKCVNQCGDNTTQPPCFPLCNNSGFSYYQDFHAEGDAFCLDGLYSDGFIAMFNEKGELQWSTFYGGAQDDIIRDLVIDRSSNQLYITGFTESDLPTDNPCGVASSTYPSGFPLCNPGSPAYFDDEFDGSFNRDCGFGTIYNGQAFISRFDLSNGALNWSTYIGGNGIDVGHSLALNSQGDVYLVGSTSTLLEGDGWCSVPTNQGFPQCFNGLSYHQDYVGVGKDHFIIRFSSDGEMLWSTYIGGNKDETSTELTGDPSVTVDAQDFVYVCGATLTGGSSFPLYEQNDLYFQDQNADGALEFADGYILSFNTGNQHIWGTYFGGSGRAIIGGLTNQTERGDHAIRALVTPSQHLYITGTSASNADFLTKCSNPEFCYLNATILPGENPTDPTTAIDVDGFIAKFDISAIVGVEERLRHEQSIGLHVYPTPSEGIVYVDFNLKDGKPIMLSVVNIVGETVFREQLSPKALRFVKVIDCSGLAKGIYLIHAVSQDYQDTKKIIIQ